MQNLNVVLIFIVLTVAAPTSSESNLLAYCGYQHSDDYPRDNDNISLDEYPWVAQLLYDEEKRCVGSLINRRYVLTAAHCLLRVDQKKLTRVRLGDTDITKARDCVNHTRFGEECSDPVEEFDIEEQIPHLEFRRITYDNDIGLIRLSRDVIYSDYIRPICLPTITNLELKDGQPLAVSGWGRESFVGTETNIKKKILPKLAPMATCRKLFGRYAQNVTDKHLCVIEGRETCLGDGGSPLMRSGQRNQWEQIGILLFAIGCGTDLPTVYVNVSGYVDWITENMHT